MRIYKRETLDEEHPLHQVKQEKAQAAIEGLLKLADLYSGIAAQSRISVEATDKYSTFRKAQKYQYIPFITKQSEYSRNETRIAELTEQAEELARKSSSGLHAGRAAFYHARETLKFQEAEVAAFVAASGHPCQSGLGKKRIQTKL